MFFGDCQNIMNTSNLVLVCLLLVFSKDVCNTIPSLNKFDFFSRSRHMSSSVIDVLASPRELALVSTSCTPIPDPLRHLLFEITFCLSLFLINLTTIALGLPVSRCLGGLGILVILFKIPFHASLRKSSET